jgi:uncharacterized protein YjbJ (UPF0337 family)
MEKWRERMVKEGTREKASSRSYHGIGIDKEAVTDM